MDGWRERVKKGEKDGWKDRWVTGTKMINACVLECFFLCLPIKENIVLPEKEEILWVSMVPPPHSACFGVLIS